MSQERIARIDVPRELVELRAYEKFEKRGGEHGRDLEDWCGAEEELERLFREVRWAVGEGGNPPCLTLRAVGRTHAVAELCRYFQRLPTAATAMDGRTPLAVVWPEELDENRDHARTELKDRKKDFPMQPDDITHPTIDQLKRADAARSPVAGIPPDEFAQLRGKLVALLLDGEEKGKVIASAPLDFEHPEKPRKTISAQVAASPYKHRRYQLREILEETPTD